MTLYGKEVYPPKIFVSWPVKPLDELKDHRTYILYEKAKANILTKEEEDEIFENLVTTQEKVCLLLMGWKFNFRGWLHVYYVDMYYDIIRVYAFNKTQVRNHFKQFGKIQKIVLAD
jgi:hypothetical protein